MNEVLSFYEGIYSENYDYLIKNKKRIFKKKIFHKDEDDFQEEQDYYPKYDW